MKRIVLTIALAVFATAALAEGTNPQKPSCAGFVSNKFGDNWELSAGMGVQTAISNGKDLGPLGKRLGFEGNISATKWLHPVAGLRFQFQGGYFNNYDPQWGKQEWPYVFMHIDFMANISNWIGGYRDDRAYYAVPFFGMGYMATNISSKSRMNTHAGFSQNFAFTYGVLNKFRLSPAVDFNIELKGLLVPSHIAPIKMGGSYLFGFSATAGFTYRFNKRGWERCNAGDGYSADDIRAFQQAVADGEAARKALEAKNADLNKELQAAREAAAAKPEVVIAPAPVEVAPQPATQTVVEPQMVILYDLRSWMLTPKELSRLNVMANQIKSGPQDQVYHIEGHADRQTGLASTNKRLADERAKGVYDYLIRKGVNAKQLTWEGKGDTANPFDVQQANRSVIIR